MKIASVTVLKHLKFVTSHFCHNYARKVQGMTLWISQIITIHGNTIEYISVALHTYHMYV